MDNASVLQIREGLHIVQEQLDTLIDVLTDLAKRYRDT